MTSKEKRMRRHSLTEAARARRRPSQCSPPRIHCAGDALRATLRSYAPGSQSVLGRSAPRFATASLQGDKPSALTLRLRFRAPPPTSRAQGPAPPVLGAALREFPSLPKSLSVMRSGFSIGVRSFGNPGPRGAGSLRPHGRSAPPVDVRSAEAAPLPIKVKDVAPLRYAPRKRAQFMAGSLFGPSYKSVL